MKIKDSVVLVTGGARRVGKAIVEELASRGAVLAVHYRTSESEADALVDRIRQAGGTAMVFQADLSRPEEIQRLFGELQDSLGRLDVLVNNAAVFYRTPFDDLGEKDLDAFLTVNLKAPFLCALHAGRKMLPRGAGKIINLADIGGFHPWRDYLPYCISKAGVIALTLGLAKELAPAVQVNAIAPGPILMPEGSSPAEAEREARRTLLKRLGSPQDIARTVCFLIESDYITGQILAVDGGRSLT
ncbi:MAG: SDR family oxidoreductase [Acidobacteria bacterium]|nr:SDR family oxidoreductase [Acidobacteriota bacterium]